MEDNTTKVNADKFYRKVLESNELKNRFDEITDEVCFKIVSDQVNSEEEYKEILNLEASKRIIYLFKKLPESDKNKIRKEINNTKYG